VFKLQQAAALWVPDLTPAVVPDLRRFTGTIYLSQSVLRQDGQTTHFLTLGEALDAYEQDLRRFTGTIYLSQSVLRQDGQTTHFLTLGEALDAYEQDLRPAELRTHFHVPVFLAEIGPFRTTRGAVEEALRLHRATPLSEHLEIETYTWDVLPAEHKSGDVVDYVSREIEFVRRALTGDPARGSDLQ
jgi:hypothetical protein